MIDGGNLPPLSEPEIVPCIFVSGFSVVPAGRVVRFVGWVELPALGDEPIERRIVVRFVMTVEAARALRDDLAKALRRPGH